MYIKGKVIKLNLTFVGDFHLKFVEPYCSANFLFLDWLYKNHKDDVILFTGDFFDDNLPHSEFLIDQAISYLVRFPEVHIISGNHELFSSRKQKKVGNPLVPLNNIPNIYTYVEPKKVTVANYEILMLPFLYNVEEMKSKYESIEDDCDFVLNHVAYPGTNFGGNDEIDLKKIKTKHTIYGHIHKPQDFDNHVVLGVPVSTRFGEQDWEKRIAVFDGKTLKFETVPDFITYEEVDFSNEPLNQRSILDIVSAPSIKAAKEKFKGFFIRSVSLIDEVQNVSYNEQKEFLNFTLQSNFEEFSKTFEVRENVKSKILELLTLGE